MVKKELVKNEEIEGLQVSKGKGKGIDKVSFDFRVAEERFYHGVKGLMSKEFGFIDWNLTQFIDSICQQ